MASIVLLGPQRLKPTLSKVLHRFSLPGKVALVTAGWQQRELEDEDLRADLDNEVVNLELHRRAEEVFANDPKLRAVYRSRQDDLREMQRLYRLRIDPRLASLRLLRDQRKSKHTQEHFDEELAHLIELDKAHLRRLAERHKVFEREIHPERRRSIGRHRKEIGEILSQCDAVAIAGGHVIVLLNRLRLFGLVDLLDTQPIFAWSAGAMVLAEKIFSYHDFPPRGSGSAEVLESGLGVAPRILPLPHARRRLQLDNEHRVSTLSRRASPLVAVAMNEDSLMIWNGRRWSTQLGVHLLEASGQVVSVDRDK